VAPHLTALPSNLTMSARETPDAVLYHIVSEGLRVMPPFHGLLTPEERWAVVYFIRSFPADPADAVVMTE
jgi:mono/diheme cytochrome c family protein